MDGTIWDSVCLPLASLHHKITEENILTIPNKNLNAINCPPVLTNGCIPNNSDHKNKLPVIK